MLVVPPLCELRKVSEDLFGISMKDMRPIFVNENTGSIKVIISVAPDVGAAVYEQHPLLVNSRQALRENAAGKSCTYDEIVVHVGLFPVVKVSQCTAFESAKGPARFHMASHVESQD